MMTNPCFCTGPDHTGKCRCQRGDGYNPFNFIKEKEALLETYRLHKQDYFGALMDQANKESEDENTNTKSF